MKGTNHLCNTPHYDELHKNLTEAVTEWNAVFEKESGLEMAFTIDDTGCLFLNGIFLCSANCLEPDNCIIYEADQFLIYTKHGEFFMIDIEWPGDGCAYIAEISKGQIIYRREED